MLRSAVLLRTTISQCADGAAFIARKPKSCLAAVQNAGLAVE
jgi:hypothetical protein